MINQRVDLTLDSREFEKIYNRKKIVSMYTLGCKVNQYETDAMIELFKDRGYDIREFDEFSDVYVINTCTVTAMSDKKSRQMIRRAKKINPESVMAVVGCYSQKSPDEIISIDGVNLVMGTSDRNKIVSEVEKLTGVEKVVEVIDIMKQREFEDLSLSNLKGKTRAFLKIQEGCDRFCSYCIIPYTRGPVRSRKLEDIIKEVKELSEKGFSEIVLTGIHVASYGKDLNEKNSLLDVITEIGKIEKVKRIRTSSVEPLIITKEFLEGISKVEQFCPHFHLSLQSGCDETLKRMNRRYDTKMYKTAVDMIRSIYPDAAITTDVIVGFPSETEDEFNETLRFLKEINLYDAHIFKYSPREGTKAALMKDQVSPQEKNQRSEALINLGKENKRAFEKRFLGEEVEVLFESHSKEGYEGHTKNYIKVWVKSKEDIQGKILKVKLTESTDEFVIGELSNINS